MVSRHVRALTAVIFYAQLTYGALFADPSQVNEKVYDYVVVGAGVGGCVVASRLAENPDLRVLLIEAGISNEGIQDTIVPFFVINTGGDTVLSWNHTSIPQAGMNGRALSLSQGRVLGGSSSINSMIYSRGTIDEYDRMARVTGDPSWSYAAMFPYMKKHEKWTPPRDGHNTEGQFDPRYHGFEGKVKVSLPNYPTGIDSRVIQALGTVPGFNYSKDMNSGRPLGFSWVQSTAGGGSRSSAATAYLTGQPNLDILVQTTVTRLIQSGKKTKVPKFDQVELALTPSSPRYIVKAGTEIILSAGVIGTPKLLMLSGIGPKSTLKKLGIPVIVENKDVGQGLQDHVLMAQQFEVSGNDTLANIFPQIPSLLPEWEANKTGPLSNVLINQIGWGRLEKNDSFLLSHPDPAAGPNSPHILYILINGFGSIIGQTPTKPHYLTMNCALVSPTSRGFVTLNSTDPFEKPVINPAYLTSPIDVHTMIEGAKGVRRFLSAPVWKDYIIAPHEDVSSVDFSSDKQIEAFVRKTSGSLRHLASTAAMSSYTSSKGVVNPNLCIKGSKGVRIVDASIFPYVPNSHTQAVVYTIAEKAADMIKAGPC